MCIITLDLKVTAAFSINSCCCLFDHVNQTTKHSFNKN